MLIVALLAIAGCAKDYVTGKRTFSLVSESQEIAMGKEADPQIVAEYGLYDDDDLAVYVSNLGQALAKESQRSQLDYTFRVVDSPIVNAFALPGGYVYMTRGILAHFNSEDALAGVLGHEIGHVVARHGAEQMSRQQLAGLGLGIGVLVSADFARFADYAGVGLNLLLLSYSRSQESESDRLGVEYSTKLGFNAHRMADFFGTLQQMSAQSGATLPSFLSTHPDPGDREVEVNRLADEWQQKIVYQPRGVKRIEYLQRIDGIVYGDDPRHGYVAGQMFYQPTMRFGFAIPANWDLMNSASTVMMIDSKKQAAVKLTLGRTASPDTEADGFVEANNATVRRRVTTTVNGFPTTIVESSVASESGDLGVLSYFIKKDDNVYAFHGFTTADLFSSYLASFTQVMESFQSVTDPAVLNKKPMRVRIKRAPQSGRLSSVLSAMGVEQDMVSAVALLNGIVPDESVDQGDWLKVVGE